MGTGSSWDGLTNLESLSTEDSCKSYLLVLQPSLAFLIKCSHYDTQMCCWVSLWHLRERDSAVICRPSNNTGNKTARELLFKLTNINLVSTLYSRRDKLQNSHEMPRHFDTSVTTPAVHSMYRHIQGGPKSKPLSRIIIKSYYKPVSEDRFFYDNTMFA